MTEIQQRRAALVAAVAPSPPRLDRRTLRQALSARLADWQTILRRNIPQGRQLLRKLLVGRITFTPVAEGIAFEAPCSLGPVFQGLVRALLPLNPPGVTT